MRFASMPLTVPNVSGCCAIGMSAAIPPALLACTDEVE